MSLISVLNFLCSAAAQIVYLYPIQGQTYFQSLDKPQTLIGNSDFEIQNILISQSIISNLSISANYKLESSDIIDISEGSLAGNPNFQNQLVAILAQSASFYQYFVQEINSNGIVNTTSNSSAISKSSYQCTDILLIGTVAYIQCIMMQNNQIVIFYQSEGMSVFTNLQTNIKLNYTLLVFSDLNFYENSTGSYLVSTIVTTQSYIYYIPVSYPNNTSVLYNSINLYHQIQYLPVQNLLMLQSNTTFELTINNSTTMVVEGYFELFTYYLSQQENLIMISLLNSSNILVYYVSVNTNKFHFVWIISISNQVIQQIFMNTKYIILIGINQLEVYELGRQVLIANLAINQNSQSYFMSQSNFIGIILNNNTQFIGQINTPALICQLCMGNGSFNSSNGKHITQYQYFTLQNGESNIYPKTSDNYSNYSLTYPVQQSQSIDLLAIGPNISINLIYAQNDVLTMNVTSVIVNGVALLKQVPNFYGITYNQHTLLFDAIINMPTLFCTQFIGFQVVNEEVCTKTTGYNIRQAVYRQISAYQTKYFMNTGQTIKYGEMDSSLTNDTDSANCLTTNVSADINSASNIVALATIQQYLYVLMPNTLLIYDSTQKNLVLEQQLNLNFRNIWSSIDYPGFLFCDSYQSLQVYQFYGNQYYQVLNIPYQIQNTSSVQVGLLLQGVYIQQINQTSQGLYFYARQNIQMIQMNQIPFQEIDIGVVMTSMTAFTSKFFYINVLNNGNTEFSIYQASESSFASLFQSTYISELSIIQIACASNNIQQYDLCYIIQSNGLPQILQIFHYQVLEVQASFIVNNFSMDLTLNIFNNFANTTANVSFNYENPLITIQSDQDNQSIITNSTQGQISINPQEYFIGNIQNYSISSNDSNVTIQPLINLSRNFTFITMFSVETLGYVFLGNPSEIYILNGSAPTKIYLTSMKTKILNLFIEVNTQFPAWILINENENFTQLIYYNISSLQNVEITMLNQSLYPGFVFVLYFDGPLIIQYTLYFWLFNISLVQNTIITTTILQEVSLNQQSEASSPYLVGFQIDQNCFGYVYTTNVNTLGMITIVQEDTFEVFQDIIGFKMTFQNNDIEQIGQQIGSAIFDGQMSYVSLLIVNQVIFYQLNLQFFNYRLASYNATNNYYFLYQPASTDTLNITVSNSLIVLSQYIDSYTILYFYPIITQPVNYFITTIAYLNLSYPTTQANCAILLSDNILLYSNGKMTLLYNVTNQLVIDYSFNQNQSNIQLTAYNQYSQQTQNITVNQWQAPIPIPPVPPSPTPPIPTPTNPTSDKGFNYWIILWVLLGLIVVLAIFAIYSYCKSRQEPQQVLRSNLGYAELVSQ